jgi:ferredoxin
MKGNKILSRTGGWMHKVTINGNSVNVEHGKRLVLAIEESGVNIGHRCGGFAKCTTCRVEFLEGEPETMTQAEYNRLVVKDLYGKARLSCQIIVNHDMVVHPLVTAENEPEWAGDTGPAPEEQVTPEQVFFPIEQLEIKT